MSVLIAIPVYNEAGYVEDVLRKVRQYADNILVLDDGSTDDTPIILQDLRKELNLDIIQHGTNLGYGRAITEAFRRASRDQYEWVITMDCDEQHEPAHIPQFMSAIAQDDLDIISGSRYLNIEAPTEVAPADRRAINMTLCAKINDQLDMTLTDAFCGFKAHRTSAMDKLTLTDSGYAFPMQLWAQAAFHNLRIGEIEVDLIYNDPNRTFGGGLDDATHRLAHYLNVFETEINSLQTAKASTSSNCC